ncbi:glycosyltransferase [Parasediminibacterium paludis]|uniref:Glycosyltransferase n=1 Tax=Parasediminibacterium paludis TaxID=908966 RepID=A0ABV8PRX6_9BACT
MISVIICSVNKQLANQVQQNIADTIGVEWEPIIIDNTINATGITSVYNQGASIANYGMLCFVHEDVLFTTQNWGKVLIDTFKNDSELGLIGLAGSKYKSRLPSGWFSGLDILDCCNITHLDKHEVRQIMHYNPDDNKLLQEVVVLDGVLLVCPKKVWQDIKFDDKLLKGFHLYDIDFSFRVAEKYKVAVSYAINLIHLTQGGSFGNEWLNDTLLWHQKMSRKLPAITHDCIVSNKKIDKIIVKKWLIRLKHEPINTVNQFKWLFAVKIWVQISAWTNVPFFMLKKYIK